MIKFHLTNMDETTVLHFIYIYINTTTCYEYISVNAHHDNVHFD